MENFPIFIDINKKPVTIFGGGEIALRKAILLVKANPSLTIISKDFSKDFQDFIKKNGLSFENKSFDPSDIKNQTLIVAATNDKEINKMISRISQKEDTC